MKILPGNSRFYLAVRPVVPDHHRQSKIVMSDAETKTEAARLDVWLWCVRAFRTRSLAAQACRKGAVSIAGRQGKPASQVRVGDEVSVKRRFVTQQLRVVGLLARRVGAKAVPEFCEDVTPEAEIAAARERARSVADAPQRVDGQGRPTKKDRRDLDDAEDRLDDWIREAGL